MASGDEMTKQITNDPTQVATKAQVVSGRGSGTEIDPNNVQGLGDSAAQATAAQAAPAQAAQVAPVQPAAQMKASQAQQGVAAATQQAKRVSTINRASIHRRDASVRRLAYKRSGTGTLQCKL